ncbi:rRNA bioproteinsis protein rrp5 [Purpureocillium lilacinum]|nr:rRNA bioproteinsis protein rrp5 [Purpureocillium lilacinum]
MSNLKRKEAPDGTPSSKTAKKLKEARPAKKDATPKDTTPASKPSKKTTEPKAPVVSLLKDDEPIFPRGGGSVLTPLEQKQIQLEAKADAMRDEEFDTGGKAQKKKKRKMSLKSDGKAGSSKKNTEDNIKVESLNFKKLVKGSLVLGQVTRINRLDLEVALPNNLAGRVSIVAISEQLTNRLQSNAAEKDDDDDDEESSDESNVDLKSLFAVGQYLRVYVVSTLDESAVTGKARRKIELSLRPAETNEGLDKDDIVANGTVMASVVSVEDHGCVMDIGIPGLRAFLPTGEIDSSIDRDRLQPGSVFLCHVTGKGKGKVVQLSLQQKALGNVKAVPTEATTISTFLPGTAVDVLVSHADHRGLSGKVMGSLDVTADLVHSGAGPNDTKLEETYKVGSKVKARVICNFPTAKEPKLGISLLPHVTSLSRMYPAQDANNLPTVVLPISSLVEKCTVRHVESAIGLFVDTGVAGLSGFVHISRVKDGKVDALYQTSGPYQVGSVHKGRVIGYSEMDGIFHISLEKSILEQQYIRLEDVPVGAVVNCEIEKLVIKEDGVAGLILKVAEGINGFVPERHMSDIRLQHPEKKFREGMKVKARVLSTNPAKRTMRLTLKKTLVNSDAPPIKSYSEVSVGMQVPGTIVKLQPNGAHIKFYGALRGFLPVSEMSEAYIRDPNEHFRVGQVVNVHVLDVDSEQTRLVVSCKDPGAFGLEKQTALKNIKLGDVVSGKVTQKTEDQVFVELADSQLKAILPVGHLTDNKSASKVQFALKRISTGQTLSNLVVIDKNDQRRAIILTQKASLIQAAKDGKLPSTFEEVKIGSILPGFVRNITQSAVFIQFSGGLHALLPKARLPADAQSKPDFGLQKYQSIEVKVVSTIPELRRVMVAPSSATEEPEKPKRAEKAPAPEDGLKVGSIVQASITSVKQTQLNVQLVGTGVQGRIDVSQVFDKWDDIPDPKDPLEKFRKKQQLKVKVIGVHDAKDHRFLPLSHRSAHSVLELSAKPSDLKSEASEPLGLDSIKVGETHVAFVNNVTPQYLWVNLSPNVRGRVSAMEASDDSSLLNDLHAHFPIGSAMRVRVTSVDTENKHLDLSARSSSSSESITWASLKPNMFLPGRITKVNERQVLVKLSETVSGPVHLPDMADNFDDIDTSEYRKNDIVRVSVVEVDAPNKRLRLSLRPSRIMSSTLPVTDKEITSFSQISSGDIVRGFVKNVADKGLFVLLGGQVTALVKIANLSDRFLKEWKDQFQVDQLVKGRVIAVDAAVRQVELSLKASMVEEDYTPPMTFKDIKEGQVVTGKVRKVEEFGAFILVDNSANVSGLCHRSQMADKAVKDATKLYKEGDAVKAKVLEVDADKRRISFGLKPSLFEDEDSDMDSDAGAPLEDESDEDVEMDEGALLKILGTDNMDDSDEDEGEEDDDEDEDEDEAEEGEGSDEDEEMEDAPNAKASGLGLGKKSAWAADPFDEPGSESDDDEQVVSEKKKRRRKGEVQVDKTAELDAHGPQTSSDYERLLLGQPDSSALWIAYMSFQMQVSDLSKAREVAERAIKSINIREETEKLNVWVAYLNLEVAYGSKQTVEDVFKRACQYNDEQTVHEKLASNYIGLNKHKEADALFETMLKKFGAKSPKVWTNYAHFLHHTHNDPARARALLPRATQQLDKRHHQAIISGFAALEFTSDNGEPERGRTMFEGLLSTWPKKGDLWSQLLDLETRRGAEADQAAVRDVFERRTRVRGLKPQQAERWFRRWAEWEEKLDPKGRERVMAKAQDWAAQFKARKEADAAAAAEADEEMEE